ncbi:MAG: polyphosphate kinase 1 [Bacteroidota bacterium]
MSKYKFFNRDISWLSFNYRVLEEAYDESLPLYERIKFLAIYSNNLEEFYRVRVSYYRSLLRELPDGHPKVVEKEPADIIRQINNIVSRHQKEFNDLFYSQIIPELRKNGIILLRAEDEITEKQEKYISQVFSHEILTAVQPMVLVKNRVKPFLKTSHVYLVLKMYTKTRMYKTFRKGKRPTYGLIKIPTDHGISRFIDIPSETPGKHYYMFLEDVIMLFINRLYPGFFVDSWHPIKITRDADLEYEDYDGDDLIELIENLETRRAIGAANRFQYDAAMGLNALQFIMETLNIDSDIQVKGGRTHNFRDFFNFPNPVSPELEHKKFTPLRVTSLDEAKNIFDAIEQQDYLLHFPYQSFDYFITFLNQAAIDDSVEEIKLTQYRVASKSAVVDALINAALNGKKVTVFVELKARFDEENNLEYAREMKKAGIKIIYSIPGLKVHAKVALVTRKPSDENKPRYLAFLGTGNFNEKTARLYGDHGLFTVDEGIIDDLLKLFNYLQDQSINVDFNQLLIAKFNLVDQMKKLIDQEIQNVRQGQKGYILLKMNGLEDPVTITKLYEASEAGVKIDLLVRGVCCVMPNQPYSRNIRIIRIVDRFLEHARVFVFYNNGKNTIYMGSADWMKRNLYRRIECVFPIKDERIKEEVLDILNIQLRDNVKGRLLDEKMTNLKREPLDGKDLRSQVAIFEYLRNKADQKIMNNQED